MYLGFYVPVITSSKKHMRILIFSVFSSYVQIAICKYGSIGLILCFHSSHTFLILMHKTDFVFVNIIRDTMNVCCVNDINFMNNTLKNTITFEQL